MSFLYLGGLLLSLLGLGFADYRYKLAFFYDKRRTLITLVIGILFFLLWDIAGIVLDIFYVGNSRYITGLRVLPEVPIEELFFLCLLCYLTLLLWRKIADT